MEALPATPIPDTGDVTLSGELILQTNYLVTRTVEDAQVVDELLSELDVFEIQIPRAPSELGAKSSFKGKSRLSKTPDMSCWTADAPEQSLSKK